MYVGAGVEKSIGKTGHGGAQISPSPERLHGHEVTHGVAFTKTSYLWGSSHVLITLFACYAAFNLFGGRNRWPRGKMHRGWADPAGWWSRPHPRVVYVEIV